MQSAATLPMTIWSSSRAGVHVDDLLAGDEEYLRARFYVMSNGSQLGGVISHRWLDDSMFCDNVFVSRELRKAQLSSTLIYESVRAYSRGVPMRRGRFRRIRIGTAASTAGTSDCVVRNNFVVPGGRSAGRIARRGCAFRV